MEITSLSTAMSQAQVREEAAVAVQAMALQQVRETSQDIQRVMESSDMIADPTRGNFLDVTA
jgi:predicted double-glycine peptidase